MKCYHLILFTLTILLSYYVSVSFAQSPRRGRIKYGRDHDNFDIQQSDKLATIENPVGEQSRTSSRFRSRAITPSTTIKTTKSPPLIRETSTRKFNRSRPSKKSEKDEKVEVQPSRKLSNRQARTFSSRAANTVGSSKSNDSAVPLQSLSAGRRKIEKSTTKEPFIGDIEEENYPQHFKERIKSQLPYRPTQSKDRPATYKAITTIPTTTTTTTKTTSKTTTTTTTTTTKKPQFVEVTTSRKSLFKPRVKIDKPKFVTSTTTSTTPRTTRSAVKTRVFFPQRNSLVEKSTADNEIYDNVPTEKDTFVSGNKFSAKFSTESPVIHRNEDAFRNSKLSGSQLFSSKYRSDSLSYSLSKSERGRQTYIPTVPPYVPLESKTQPMHINTEKTAQMVFDEEAGVWNMVEIVPNGLTRSEIIVDTGDGFTQELEDQLGSSATISIYSALADILTKNAPLTTTTTTTTTSTTTELPEIIKENPVLLDILKKNYIRGNGSGSKSVFSLTTAKSAIESSTISSGNDVFDEVFGIGKPSLENTLNDSTESKEAEDNFILKPTKSSVGKTAIPFKNDVLADLRSGQREPSTTSSTSTTTPSTTTITTTASTTTTTSKTTPTTTTMRPTQTTTVPSTSSVPRYIMTITPEIIIDNANSVDFERDFFSKTSTTTATERVKPSASIERNLELLQELLSLQAKLEKQNVKKTTHTPAATLSTVPSTEAPKGTTTTSTPRPTTTATSTPKATTTATTTPRTTTTKRIITNEATKSIFSNSEDLAFLENLKKAINQQKSTKPSTTSTQPSTTYMQDLFNSFQSATPPNTKTTLHSDQEDLAFLNNLRQLGKINVTTPQSPTFANRVIELAALQRNKTTPVTSTTSKATPAKSSYNYRKDEAQLGQDLALLSTLLGRRISAEDIPRLAQQYKPKTATTRVTTTKPTTTRITTTTATPTTQPPKSNTQRVMSKDELSEVEKNLKLLSSILGRPISIEELPTIMKQYRFGRNPTRTTTSTTTSTTTTEASPVIDSNTPITREEVIELLKDPEIGLGENIDTYGKTNDAILAAVLKQKGIGPAHNNVPVDDLFMQGPTPTPYITTNRPRVRRPYAPYQQPAQQQQNPLLSGLSWLWRTWQETAPAVRPGRGPSRANRNSQLQIEGSEDYATEVEHHQPIAQPEYPQGGGLLAAAFGVTRAVTQFLGTAFQGAAKSFQQSWNTENAFATSG